MIAGSLWSSHLSLFHMGCSLKNFGVFEELLWWRKIWAQTLENNILRNMHQKTIQIGPTFKQEASLSEMMQFRKMKIDKNWVKIFEVKVIQKVTLVKQRRLKNSNLSGIKHDRTKWSSPSFYPDSSLSNDITFVKLKNAKNFRAVLWGLGLGEILAKMLDNHISGNNHNTFMIIELLILWSLPLSYGEWFQIIKNFQTFLTIYIPSKVEKGALIKQNVSRSKRNWFRWNTQSFDWCSSVLNGMEFKRIRKLKIFSMWDPRKFSIRLWKISREIVVRWLC